MNLYQQAARLKFRFPSQMGLLTLEDLWDLKLPYLDDIAQELHKQVKDLPEVSFIGKNTNDPTFVVARFEIVKNVIATLLLEKEERENRVKKKNHFDTLWSILQKKKYYSFKNLPMENLEKKVRELQI